MKIPASALPENESVGTEIVTINLTDTTHPEYYFRVVFYDSSSSLPRSSSLCINLQYLGVETGKPPLPKEIKAEAVYVGKKKLLFLPPIYPRRSGNAERSKAFFETLHGRTLVIGSF